jgi:thiopurine S-methyltransferase
MACSTNERSQTLDAELWHERWREGRIGFHLNETNPNLSEWYSKLELVAGQSVFVPLCGKSLDLLWLGSQGLDVVGVEISELAVRSFFEENGLEPEVASVNDHDQWCAGNITILHANYFDLQPNDLGPIDAVYDRASLIALPPDMRGAYAEKMRELVSTNVPMLLITLDYPGHQMSGPPFPVSSGEVGELYGDHYRIERLACMDLLSDEPHWREKGLEELTENIYLLGR